MNTKDKVKVYDIIRLHIINAERELGNPPKMSIPYLPNMDDDGSSVRAFYRHLKASAVEHAEWFASEKEISNVRHIFEIAGEDMRSVSV